MASKSKGKPAPRKRTQAKPVKPAAHGFSFTYDSTHGFRGNIAGIDQVLQDPAMLGLMQTAAGMLGGILAGFGLGGNLGPVPPAGPSGEAPPPPPPPPHNNDAAWLAAYEAHRVFGHRMPRKSEYGDVPPEEALLRKAYRDLIRKAHPDAGGSAADAARINNAWDVVCEWRGWKR